jgi:hypothetical protein
MGRHETIVSVDPPANRAPAVLARLKIAERELAELKLQIPERALAAAEDRPGAKEALAALHQKIAATAFEIDCNPQAQRLAARLDQEALVAYRAAIQTLSPEEIIQGITKDSCCRRCPGAGRCVITGADPVAGGACAHPALQGALALNSHRDNSKVLAVYTAACVKLGLRKLHA